MTLCIFAGPSVHASDRARFQDVTWLAPAQQGDVQRAVALLQPRYIGLIDGYFRWVPSVWHKEILWAMSRGVHVFGAASMGALRAAELTAYGMRGVGCIFQAFKTGVLAPFAEPFEDDDEVAVVHGPEDSGYLAASEAMVNIRLTLVAAERAGVISGQTRQSLVGLAKALYFPARTYDRIIDEARRQGIAPVELDALQAFLRAGRVDQKRSDALAMIEALQAFHASQPGPCRPAFRFEHTTFWERALRSMDECAAHDADDSMVLAEARLQGDRFIARWKEALAALLSPPPVAEPGAGPGAPPAESMQRRRQDYAMEQLARRTPARLIERHLLARLRRTGEYADLLARARDKRERLRGRVDLAEVWTFRDLQLLDLENWYFTQCLDREMPDELHAYVARLGYPDMRGFHEAIFAEHCYRGSIGLETVHQDERWRS